MGAKGFNFNSHQSVFKEIKETIPFISGTGIWRFNNGKCRLFPLDLEEKIKELPPQKQRFYYRGANIMDRVDDFRMQIEKGGT